MSLMNHDEIAKLIPHGADMCLLDDLVSWDDAAILCVSRAYRGAENPLRNKNGTLGTACGIELAAQAMALHGRLTAVDAGPSRGGMLASVRDVRFGAPHLDAGTGDLTIAAERLLGDSAGATYSFSLACNDIEMLSGRATVLLGIAA